MQASLGGWASEESHWCPRTKAPSRWQMELALNDLVKQKEVLLEHFRAELSARRAAEANLAEALDRLTQQSARAEAAEARLAELQPETWERIE